MSPARNASEWTIVVIMRLLGVGGLSAALAIIMPDEWMRQIHEQLGLGQFPSAPIVGYLARSLSAFYAIHGAMVMTISLDIRRYRPLVRVWSWLVLGMGFVLLGVDLAHGMPLWWTLSEGPPMACIGCVLVFCQTGISPVEDAA